MSDLERVRAAFEHVVNAPVEMMTRAEWEARLRPGGAPTRLSEPFGPYLGIQGNPGFEYAVASGAPHADEPGLHHLRRDEQDTPKVWNLDSHVVIEDLTADPRWPEVLRFLGREATLDLLALVREHVFAYVRQRDDHRSDMIP